MKTKKIVCLILTILLLFYAHTVEVFALEFGNIPVLEEIDLPDDLNFSVSDTRLDHIYFEQVTAREDGSFAVYSCYHDPKNYVKGTFERKYIDIYDADGNFLQELFFTTSQPITAELTDETLNIYTYISVLVYDLETQELHNYATPEGAVAESGLMTALRAEEFVSGEWTYHCEEDFDGYTKLVRSNGEEEQVLVEMPGTGNSFWNLVFPGIALGFLLLVLKRVLKKAKSKKSTTKKKVKYEIEELE